jgi:hypothetical protein
MRSFQLLPFLSRMVFLFIGLLCHASHPYQCVPVCFPAFIPAFLSVVGGSVFMPACLSAYLSVCLPASLSPLAPKSVLGGCKYALVILSFFLSVLGDYSALHSSPKRFFLRPPLHSNEVRCPPLPFSKTPHLYKFTLLALVYFKGQLCFTCARMIMLILWGLLNTRT